jgi:uncharacterized protein (UPF0548 family)
VYVIGRMPDVPSLLSRARDADVTYQPIGATLAGLQPPGFRHDRRSVVLSERKEAFTVARQGLRTWQAHRGIGAVVSPEDPPLEGATVVVMLRRGPLRVIAPCRIVAVVDDHDRYGFAYGTLPGHPEHGEESFVVERQADRVTFEITAFSRPADRLAKLGGPLTHLIQQQATRGYLAGLREWLAGSI